MAGNFLEIMMKRFFGFLAGYISEYSRQAMRHIIASVSEFFKKKSVFKDEAKLAFGNEF